jgi:hypothetical protein
MEFQNIESAMHSRSSKYLISCKFESIIFTNCPKENFHQERKEKKFKCKTFSILFHFYTIGCKNRSSYARIEDIDYVLTTQGIHQTHSFINLSILLSIIFRFNRYGRKEAERSIY